MMEILGVIAIVTGPYHPGTTIGPNIPVVHVISCCYHRRHAALLVFMNHRPELQCVCGMFENVNIYICIHIDSKKT